MLTIEVPKTELWNEETQSFINVKARTIRMEHSLVSISKWEAITKKPFLSEKKKYAKTDEELIMYMKCMTITQNVPDIAYKFINEDNIDKITNYIHDSKTATTFNNKTKTGVKKIITSELIYYWMIALNIPMECQKWHLNRLLTLINVCNLKNKPKKKMSKRELQKRNRDLNAKRRAKFKTRG